MYKNTQVLSAFRKRKTLSFLPCYLLHLILYQICKEISVFKPANHNLVLVYFKMFIPHVLNAMYTSDKIHMKSNPHIIITPSYLYSEKGKPHNFFNATRCNIAKIYKEEVCLNLLIMIIF